jgi:hypothetical protein
MRALGLVVTLMVVAIWSAGGVLASSQSLPQRPVQQVVADLEGRQIKSALISSFYCHDFDFPLVHCYRSAAALARAESRWGAQDGKLTTESAAFGVNDYVSIFDGNAYTGAGMDVSQNYDVLFTIGWNDRISSFKGRNSAYGEFWTDWYATGTGRPFCCNALVSSLPSGQDNAFSSVYRH